MSDDRTAAIAALVSFIIYIGLCAINDRSVQIDSGILTLVLGFMFSRAVFGK